jgi:hypothetical protein
LRDVFAVLEVAASIVDQGLGGGGSGSSSHLVDLNGLTQESQTVGIGEG